MDHTFPDSWILDSGSVARGCGCGATSVGKMQDGVPHTLYRICPRAASPWELGSVQASIASAVTPPHLPARADPRPPCVA
eukprot:5859578-Prymnesium_polylepis.1